ncbi:MAG: hypothetical protein IIB00_05990, partial [candidate division Zixibacteria bacterium]|nr:hypothetical protein [candidate division Zixibacteria bacterium]
VSFAFALFRSDSLTDFGGIALKLLYFDFAGGINGLIAGYNLSNPTVAWFQLFLSIAVIAVMEMIQSIRSSTGIITGADIVGGGSISSHWRRWSIDYALILGVILLGVYTKTEFIYFQF